MFVKLESGAHGRRRREDDARMATLTKVCFYSKRSFDAAHRLANVCSPDCQKAVRAGGRTRTPARAVRAGIDAAEPAVKLPEETHQAVEIGRTA
jgi:hypothetical protein